ncbi:VgrG-related protein [Paraconexibacter algicola]|uniref:Gp5/Type VI secretion system Vgr protein OB-fold domain-containing protein n=1 Tax=Paraconexibacter algicola TaxID=2133960 RepID=A0A2T4UGG8_9ACTN|nr:VgrG-related protein [Paraconexibacter algicola]PTL58289.1 hypothetical protein C7Y72_00815 [Paraconexibacter algicola]
MSPADSAVLAPGIDVKLGGSPLDPLIAAQLAHAEIDLATGLPDRATLRFNDHRHELVDHRAFVIGAKLEIKLGAALQRTAATVFVGEVAAVEVEFGGELGTTIDLVAFDATHRMHNTVASRTFKQASARDALQKIAAEHGLRVGSIDTVVAPAKLETIDQVAESDWRFLTRLLRDAGGRLQSDLGTLTVVEVGAAARGAREIELAWGQGLLRFRPRASGAGQRKEVVVTQWDPEQKRETVAKAPVPKTAPALKRPAATGRVTYAMRPGEGTKTTEPLAKAAAAEVARHFLEAEAVAHGDPRLRPGATANVTGVGKRFGGKHVIVGATHVFHAAGGYVTRLRLGGGESSLLQDLGSAPARRATDQLVVGVVTNTKDPKKLGRVKVKIPVLEGLETDWARVALGSAGANRGTYQQLMVDDEVVLGFEHGDIERCFVLGVLHNGKDKPDAAMVDPATAIGIRQDKDLDAAFKGKALVATDKGMTVKAAQGPLELTANKAMTLKSETAAIAIEASASDVKVDAKGQIAISGVSAVKISSTAQLSIEANGPLKLKGAIVEINATAMAKISGATVMLG